MKLFQLKHGESIRKDSRESAEYRTWALMKRRCNNPNDAAFQRYGGSGVSVCLRWSDSFECFLADMGRKPTPQHTIDRFPNKNGNYEPGNCRWATKREQALNRKPTSEERRASLRRGWIKRKLKGGVSAETKIKMSIAATNRQRTEGKFS